MPLTGVTRFEKGGFATGAAHDGHLHQGEQGQQCGDGDDEDRGDKSAS
jgi:hypothetical protein